jgi:hypothetical protein
MMTTDEHYELQRLGVRVTLHEKTLKIQVECRPISLMLDCPVHSSEVCWNTFSLMKSIIWLHHRTTLSMRRECSNCFHYQ